ncbi:MAG: ubiquitin-like domain-containing protein [Candidatus Eremiobacteraeota bacterium]|nr:ubiquitin-like domain-containing protein [Candidatus Eremiobacteraeota bacterium]
MLSVTMLTAGVVCAGFFTHPSPAFAQSAETQTISHIVTFQSAGTIAEHATNAVTVGDFLRERGIVVGERDFVEPAPDVPLSDRLTIVYRPAVPVSIVNAGGRINVVSAAENIGALLSEQHVILTKDDAVTPSLSQNLIANQTIHVARTVSWNRTEKRAIHVKMVRRFDISLAPGTSRVIAKGTTGERDIMVRFTQRDNRSITRTIVSSRVVRKAHPRIVAQGVAYTAFARIARRGIEQTAYVAASALNMVATAYTAGCSGCSGITSSGRSAGRGVVAVDPGVISLGTRLYIPGYGLAIAGDTGGTIRGRRIDLGFNSLRDAMLFGRREVVVYRLK